MEYDLVSVERISDDRGYDEWLNFVLANRPASVNYVLFETWAKREVDRLRNPEPLSQRCELYIARLSMPGSLHRRRAVGAIHARWSDGRVDLKAFALDRNLDTRTKVNVIRSMLRKIQIHCQREGICSVRIRADRGVSLHLLACGNMAIRSTDGDSQEVIFERQLSPLFSGDPANFEEVCRWFVESVWRARIEEPEGQLITAASLSAWSFRFTLTPESSRLVDSVGTQRLFPGGLAVVFHRPATPEQLRQVVANCPLSDGDILALFVPEPVDTAALGRDCLAFTPSDILTMMQESFVAGRLHDDRSAADEEILRRIFNQRFRLPLEGQPAAILVDVREENFQRLVNLALKPEKPGQLIHASGTATGLSLKAGRRLIFFVWDSQKHLSGAIGGVGVITDSPVRRSSPELPTDDEFAASGFEDSQSLTRYLRHKATWHMVPFDQMRTAEGPDALTYEDLAAGLLGVPSTDEELCDAVYRHWPSEDIGHTYLSSDQLDWLLSRVSLQKPSSSSQWVARDHTVAQMADLLSQIVGWTTDKASEWVTYRPLSELRRSMDRPALENFLSQLPTDHHVFLMKELLSHIDFWDDRKMIDAFAKIRESATQQTLRNQIVLVPFGGEKDSASLLSYVMRELNVPTADIREVLANPGIFPPSSTCLLLFDDNLATGWQASLILSQFLGLRDDRNRKEFHSCPLEPHQIEAWKKYENRFAFLSANEEEARKFTDWASRHIPVAGYHAAVPFTPPNLFTPTGPLFQDRDDRETLIERTGLLVRAIGIQLLKDKAIEDGWDSAKQERYSLGYGGLQQLRVFSHNTPTSTLTLLWKEGEFDGRDWVPLFPRRGRAKAPGLREYVCVQCASRPDSEKETIIRAFESRELSLPAAVAALTRLEQIEVQAARTRPDETLEFEDLVNAILDDFATQSPWI